MDEREREAWQTVLEGALRDRAELNTTISLARRKLGLPDDDSQLNDDGSGASTTVRPGADPVASTLDGEFFGMSGPQATEALMRKFGRSRPLKTDEIFNAIRKGGVEIKSKEGLYRTLTRDPDFHRVGRGSWGLSEWYPARARRKEGDGNGSDADNGSGNGPEDGEE